jgi:hypothetical protein
MASEKRITELEDTKFSPEELLNESLQSGEKLW